MMKSFLKVFAVMVVLAITADASSRPRGKRRNASSHSRGKKGRKSSHTVKARQIAFDKSMANLEKMKQDISARVGAETKSEPKLSPKPISASSKAKQPVKEKLFHVGPPSNDDSSDLSDMEVSIEDGPKFIGQPEALATGEQCTGFLMKRLLRQGGTEGMTTLLRQNRRERAPSKQSGFGSRRIPEQPNPDQEGKGRDTNINNVHSTPPKPAFAIRNSNRSTRRTPVEKKTGSALEGGEPHPANDKHAARFREYLSQKKPEYLSPNFTSTGPSRRSRSRTRRGSRSSRGSSSPNGHRRKHSVSE